MQRDQKRGMANAIERNKSLFCSKIHEKFIVRPCPQIIDKMDRQMGDKSESTLHT